MSASTGILASFFAQSGAGDPGWTGASERWEFTSESVRKEQPILIPNGIRGTRSQPVERTRLGPFTIGGTVTVEGVSPAFLDAWLPRILGAGESSDTFEVAETLPEFGLLFNRVGDVYEYQSCKVSTALLRGSAGGSVDAAIDILGLVEATDAVPPAVSLGVTADYAPYMHTDLSLDLRGAARRCRTWELRIDNVLRRIAYNSLQADCLLETDRVVTLNATVPFTAAEANDLYGQPLGGGQGTLSLINGNMSTVATFPALQVGDRTAVVANREEVLFEVQMTARMSGSTREVEFTNDPVFAS